jgi:hypothetical protein
MQLSVEGCGYSMHILEAYNGHILYCGRQEACLIKTFLMFLEYIRCLQRCAVPSERRFVIPISQISF